MVNALHLFRFDGYEFTLARLGLEGSKYKVQIAGMIGGEELAGYILDSEEDQLFFLNLSTGQVRRQSFSAYGRLRKVSISEDKKAFLIFEKGGQWSFYRWKDGHLELETRIAAPFSEAAQADEDIAIEAPLNDERSCWIYSDSEIYLLRVDKSTGAVRKFYPADFEGGDNAVEASLLKRSLEEMKALRSGGLYISRALNGSRKLFRLDPSAGRFSQVKKGMPSDWESQYVFKDGAGNLAFLFKGPEGSYRAILQDTAGRRYDYSAFFEKLKGVSILNMASPDFRKQAIICHAKGILLHTVKDPDAIQQYLPLNSIRAMAELPGEQYLASTQSSGAYLIDGQSGAVSRFELPGCPISGQHFKFIPDASGNIWASNRANIILYNPTTHSCETYPCQSGNIRVFTFIGDGRIALVDNLFRLYFFNIHSGKTEPFLENGAPKKFSGYVHDIHYSRDGWLWIATSDGLWKIRPETGEAVVTGFEAPFLDSRFTCIHEDEKGRLWLGTPLEGLHIYDPRTEDVKILNDEDGLANNTVVSILPDDEGVRWVGTYNGLSLVSPEGNLITNIYPEDGLVDRENNRYAYLKASNGQLLIGTVKGLNIISPEKIKERMGGREEQERKAFLTTLKYYDAAAGKDTVIYYGLDDPEPLRLPASRRYLNLSFAVSNYFKPGENRYAYQLEGLDEEWHFLGNQHSLALNNLPAGRYRLLIRGGDAFGNWTSEPLALPIHAREVFYKRAWFFLLCFLLLGGLAMLWIYRLRLEVRKATYMIRLDKELIEEQAARLQELDEAKSRFFTNISHEFRTPLTIISGMIDQVAENPGRWLQKGAVMIKRNSLELLNLVNQILDLRKLESKELKARMVQGNVVAHLRYLSESHQSFAQSRRLQLHFLSAAETIMMDYDPEKLMRIVSNLLSNAVKYTPAGGEVYFRVEQVEDGGCPYLRLEVEDTGVGIPEEQLARVFEQFYQAPVSLPEGKEKAPSVPPGKEAIRRPPQAHHPLSEGPGGAGIDLALVRELVRLLGGRIGVDSTPAKGSTFRVDLPITNNAPLAEPDAPAGPAKELLPAAGRLPGESKQFEDGAQPAGGPRAGRPLLLIVEDNPDVQQFLIACLEENYRLEIAANGQEGIDKAIDQVPDLIVSDVMMPEKNGYELCGTLKNDLRTSHIPIILLTARADTDSRISGLERGADAYLAKPFERRELLVRLEKLLELRRKLQERYAALSPAGQPPSVEEALEDEFITKLRDAVLDNIQDEDFGVRELCQILVMSRTQLHHKAKALTGKSTSLAIRSIRLQRGRELLETTGLSISQVAYESGFRHPAHFTRYYTREFGESPTETRKRL